MKHPQAYQHNIWLHIFPNQYPILAKQVPLSISPNEARQQYIRQLSIRYLANTQLLHQHLKTLTPLQQSIIHLHFTDRQSCQQIATQLQLPLSKTKKQLTAAIILLRMKMNPTYYAPLRQIMRSSYAGHKASDGSL